jgi:hypothetical protein
LVNGKRKGLEVSSAEYRGWDKWAEKFKPIKNHIFLEDDEHMYETFGPELEFVVKQNARHIWTWIQGDMCDVIVAGYDSELQLGYYITELPWENEDDYALLSDHEVCECDEQARGEGNPDCQKCEGSGITKKWYVD